MFELKTSYVFFGTDTDALQIVYCEQYPQAKGMTLEEFTREYFSSPVTGEMEADFDCEALVEFLRRKNNGRTVSFSSRDGKYSYRFTAYSHPNEEGIVYCSVNKIEGKDFNGDYARDYLTGVYTRSYLIDGIEKQLSEGAEGALILVDLDDFKKINDTLGHAVGDECLSRISAGLGEACEGELLGRYGGARRGENRADMQKDPRHPLYRRAEKDEKTADRHVQLRRFLCAQRREKFFTAVRQGG